MILNSNIFQVFLDEPDGFRRFCFFNTNRSTFGRFSAVCIRDYNSICPHHFSLARLSFEFQRMNGCGRAEMIQLGQTDSAGFVLVNRSWRYPPTLSSDLCDAPRACKICHRSENRHRQDSTVHRKRPTKGGPSPRRSVPYPPWPARNSRSPFLRAIFTSSPCIAEPLVSCFSAGRIEAGNSASISPGCSRAVALRCCSPRWKWNKSFPSFRG